jgi:ferrous iron transport protein A
MSDRDEPVLTRPLSASRRGSSGVVARVEYRGASDPIAERLEALGFVAGEPVRVVATGPLGGEPIVVLIGSTRFALRHAEAARVLLHDGEGVQHG